MNRLLIQTALLAILLPNLCSASQDTLGSNGIYVLGPSGIQPPLNGMNIGIGQVELAVPEMPIRTSTMALPLSTQPSIRQWSMTVLC